MRFGVDLPATGFGVNVDSITKIMLSRGEVAPPPPPSLLVHAGSGFETKALKKAEELAQTGVCCEFSVFVSLDDAKDYAKKRRIPKILIVGSEDKEIELETGS